jgi:hypothetical protein
MKRKRGAPPGNQNAFRHGFYSSRFRQLELQALSQSSALELADEIALMRVATARLLASLDSHTEPRDLQTELSILRAFNLSVDSIRALIRTRLMLTRDGWTLPPRPERPNDGDHAAPDPGGQLTGATPIT